MKKRIIFAILTVLILVISLTIWYYLENKQTFSMDINHSNISKITVKNKEKTIEYQGRTEIKDLTSIIAGKKRTTKNLSITDFPSVTDYIEIVMVDTSNKIVSIYVYTKENKHYIEQPYNGIYEISAEEYNNINQYILDGDIVWNNYYKEIAAYHYKDIRELSENYSTEQAIKDNCFISNSSKNVNQNTYENFMKNYDNKISSFLRIVELTDEGDNIIFDVKYDKNINKIIVVIDTTRDKFSNLEDRKRSLQEFDHIGKYKMKDLLYWVAYNGELNENTLKTNNVLVLSIID